MSDFLKSLVPCEVNLLVLPESSMMCVASVLEPIRAANRVAGKRIYNWTVTSLDGGDVVMTCGLPLQVNRRFEERETGDLLIVIGGFNQERHVRVHNLATVRKAASRFSLIVGVEAGSWVLARAGLFNGFQATTHWEDFDAFTEAFPEVDVRLDRYVRDRSRLTCGGASPAFDMMLDLIRQRDGPAIAMEVASVFIYDEAHSQFDEQPLVSLGRVARKERRLEHAVRLMEKAIEQPLPIAAIAKRVGVSVSTLESVFKRFTGMTPGRFYLNLRIKAANRLVLDTDLSLREIAIRCGFNSLSAFSRAYTSGLGHSARTVRSQLQP